MSHTHSGGSKKLPAIRKEEEGSLLYDHACDNQLQRQDRQENTWYTHLPEFGHKSEQLVAYDMRAHLFGPSLRVKTV